ncbi:hypothetical protein GGR55DRAFT_647470 [Xylaria sp. FL0064]|nr:hypothetical protein GGR55DRAFT_647470 [Xylaria sp. FL0064]
MGTHNPCLPVKCSLFSDFTLSRRHISTARDATPTRSFQVRIRLLLQAMSDNAGTPASFVGLPSELRNEIYELILWHQVPIDPWARSSSSLQQSLTLGLFHVNRAVYREASSLFYSKNCFDLSDAIPGLVVSFLEEIGNNATYIRHVIINFPDFINLCSGRVTLMADSEKILDTIQRRCTSLSSLKTPFYSTRNIELSLRDLDNHDAANEALELVDTQFKAIPSLREVILEADEVAPSDHVRQRMESYGWTIDPIQQVEEDSGESLSPFDEDDYGYDHDGDSGDNDDDDYDIDNDSDFWRRAAD